MKSNTAKKENIIQKASKNKARLSFNQIKAARCRASFYYFLREFWPEICHEEAVWNWHIPYLCSILEELARNVAAGKPKLYDPIINVPPGSTKSIICMVAFPVWCWTDWYWMRFLCGSHTTSLSLFLAEQSREIIRSDKFKDYFPELSIKKDEDAKGKFKLAKKVYDSNGEHYKTLFGGSRISTSVGSKVKGFHAHIILIDDPLDPQKEDVSETEIRNANFWMDNTLSTRKVDKEQTPTVLIMQRLHQMDPTGNILDKNLDNIFHICIPGEIDNYRDDVKPKELIKFYKDGLLDPVRLNRKALKELEAKLGQYGYAGQIGQRPTPPGGGMFKVDHLQIVDRYKEGNQIIRYWDKAGTQGGGAYTVGVKMTRLDNGKFLVLDVKRGQWASEEREAIIKETTQADGKHVIIWLEQEGGSGGKESAESTIRNLAGYTVYKESPTGDKAVRADPFSVQVNNGNVLLLRAEWNHDYKEELRYFPFSTYKDQVDASSGAFNKLALSKFVEVI